VAERSQAVELTTVALGEILERENAPRFIHFMSLDIEGAEFEALRSIPFDKYTFGALAIEHNFEEPKRHNILTLLENHGYKRSHIYSIDDYYVPAERTAAR
jgi:Methyltransferase FkbM domain